MASRYLINCSVIDTNLILKRPCPFHPVAVTSYVLLVDLTLFVAVFYPRIFLCGVFPYFFIFLRTIPCLFFLSKRKLTYKKVKFIILICNLMSPLKEKYLPLATIKKWSWRETAFNFDKVLGVGSYREGYILFLIGSLLEV